MLTTAERDAILATFDGTFVALFSAVTDHRAGTVTELDEFPRQEVELAAAGNTTPAGGRQRVSSNEQAFGANPGSEVSAIAWGLFDAASGGSPRVIGYLGTKPARWGTAETGSEDITVPAHTLEADQIVRFMAHPGAPMPTGLSENTDYYVIAAGLTTDVFRVSDTEGGSAVDLTTAGAMLVIPRAPLIIQAGAEPIIQAGGVVVQI